MAIPKKVAERIASGMKRLVPILEQQKARDVSEADTVTLVKDILSEVFGYDKYAELTGEFAIRGTYCDLAIRLDEKIVQLIEVKAVGITLNDRHVKQAIDYAANQGIEWVILTNAIVWQLYHVLFSKPIDQRLITEVDLVACDIRNDAHLETLHLFSKDGFQKGAPADLRDKQDATDRFLLAALILNNDSVISVIQRELRRIVDIMVSEEDILKVLEANVIKRDTLEGPAAETAVARVRRTCGKVRRQETPKPAETPACDAATAEPAPAEEKSPAANTPETSGQQPTASHQPEE